ncbi:hypothetical protein Tco_1423535 [Tanacetum coccineum]
MSIRTSAEVLLLALEASQLNRQIQNKNTGTSETLVARKGINDHKRKFDDRRNTTTNNNNNYSNNHNRNNDFHQQQNRRQDEKYHGNLPLCTRCTLHHTRVCTVRKGHYKSQCSKTYNSTFHVSKKSLCDESLVIPMKEIWLDDKLKYVEEPMEIMEREVKQLRQRCIPIIKVRWNYEFTWEREDEIHAKYPHLFSNITSTYNNLGTRFL